MVDEDILPYGMIDSMLYVDSLDDVPVPTPPASGEGVTDGSTSTDFITPTVENNQIVKTELDEVTETYYRDVDFTGFEPVTSYHFDENGMFVIDEA